MDYERRIYSARAQLAEIFDYIEQENPRAAREVQATIKSSIELLGRFPFSGRATDEPGVRVLTIIRYRHRAFYRLQQDDVLILRILHAARNEPLS